MGRKSIPQAPDYRAQKITAELIRKVASWPPPPSPKEIHDSASGLVLRHQPSGFLGLYVQLGRGKRERPFGQRCDARRVIDPTSALTLGAVKEEAKRLRGEDASGRSFKAERQAERAIPTLDDYLNDTYGPWVVQNRRSGQATLDRIKACFSEDFGDEKLNAITIARLEKWVTARQRDGVKAETINRDVEALRPAIARAVKLKILPAHPFAGWEPLEVDKSKREVRALTAAEEAQLRAVLEARDEQKADERARANEWRQKRHKDELPSLHGLYADALTPAVLVSLTTGLRRGELFALEWPNVDFAAKVVRVEGKTAKTFQSREIPMNAEALSVLRRWWLQLGQPKAGPVFGGIKNLRKSFRAALKAAGIKNTKAGRITWHSLRHSFGTRLGASGVDAATLRDLLGHRDLEVTNRYLHSDEDRKRAAVELLLGATS